MKNRLLWTLILSTGCYTIGKGQQINTGYEGANTYCPCIDTLPLESGTSDFLVLGTVYNKGGEPLNCVCISVFDKDQLITTSRTGLNGNFEIEGLPIGNYSFHFSRSGLKLKVMPVTVVGKGILDLTLHISD